MYFRDDRLLATHVRSHECRQKWDDVDVLIPFPTLL